MAFNLDAIKRRIEELNNQRNYSSVQLWKPPLGIHRVRGIHWKNAPEGQPFIERWFYYLGEGGSAILSPKQFGKPDPINDLIRKLYSSGTADDKQLAKKLRPSMRTYMAIIVRGQEEKGVQVWSFGATVYQKLLGYFIDSDVGDIMDVEDGFDLKVTLMQKAGKIYPDTDVEAVRKPSRLSDNPDLVKAWIDSVPNIDDMYRQKTKEEIETLLNAWLNSGETPDTSSNGLTKGGKQDKNNELDKLVNEVKGLSTKPIKAATTHVDEGRSKVLKPNSVAGVAKNDRKSVPVIDSTQVLSLVGDGSCVEKSLDDAFADLTKDD